MRNFKSLDYNQYLFQFICENSNYDVKIIPNDSTAIIQAHKIILASASDYFHNIFKDLPSSDDEIFIHVPDFNYRSVNLIVNFIYMGEIEVSTNELNTFLDLCNLFSLKSFDRLIANDEMSYSGIMLPTTTNDQYYENYKIIKTEYEDDISESLELSDCNENTSNISTQMPIGEDIADIKIEEKPIRDNSLKYPKPKPPLNLQKRLCDLPLELRNKYKHLNEALNSIITDGMSYKKAAKIYKISSTVLWRRVKILKQARRAMANTKKKLKPISPKMENREKTDDVDDNVPLINLYRLKRNLSTDMNPHMHEAYLAYKNGMLQTRAAALYNIPKTTFWRYVKRMAIEEGHITSSTTIANNGT